MLATATRTSPAAVAANKRRCRFIAGLLRFHSLCNTIARPPPFGMFVLPQNDVGLLTNVNGWRLPRPPNMILLPGTGYPRRRPPSALMTLQNPDAVFGKEKPCRAVRELYRIRPRRRVCWIAACRQSSFVRTLIGAACRPLDSSKIEAK